LQDVKAKITHEILNKLSKGIFITNKVFLTTFYRAVNIKNVVNVETL
jgi:hypothetical protein